MHSTDGGWGSFPQALQLLASMGIHFFWVIWPCLILEKSKPPFCFYKFGPICPLGQRHTLHEYTNPLRDSSWSERERLYRITTHLHTFLLNFVANSRSCPCRSKSQTWEWVTSGRFVTANHCQCKCRFMNCVLNFLLMQLFVWFSECAYEDLELKG